MNSTPVVILCGGRGIYIDDSGLRRSKALIEVAGAPLVIHVIRRYISSGYRKFILAAGYQIQELKQTLETCYQAQPLSSAGVYKVTLYGAACEVTVVDTGIESTTGDRIKKIEPLLGDAPLFCVTYSDTLTTVDLAGIQDAHEKHGAVATLLATKVPTRFRILGMRPGDSHVRGFAAKPVIQNDQINGGFYVFNRAIFVKDYLGAMSPIILEEIVLESLAARGELIAIPCEGSWHFLDSERDLKTLEQIAKVNG